MTDFIIDEIRVQLLSERIVRLEQAENGAFCDCNTYFIPNRSKFEGVKGTLTREGGCAVVAFGENRLCIPAKASLNGAYIEVNGVKRYTYRRLKNTGELPLPEKTPFVFPLADAPHILIPDEGYTSGAEYSVGERVTDVYLLICGGDHKLLRSLFVELTGRTEMVRLSTLGLWNSRYYRHDDASARALINAYAEHGVPLDNMVLDTDWRKASDRGIGYEVDNALFPDIKSFFDFAHENGVEITFNDHPEPVDGASSLLDGKEIEYRERNLKEHLGKGLDCWWYDRNWHTRLVSPASGVNPESLGAYAFYEITKSFFKEQSKGKPPRRPVIMANVDNISNGSYVGINDSASHRYSVQWTGDIPSDGASIGTEIKNMLLAGSNLITYVNSDCGGHTGNPGKEEYIRWMQFGAFSPVLRPHCTNYVARFREPWAYDEETLEITRSFINMRYRLMPEIYKNAYESYLGGAPLFKPLSYEYADDKRTHGVFDEYLLGDGILVAPLYDSPPEKVAAANYVSPVKAAYFDGVECAGKPLYETEYKRLDLYWRHVPPAPGVPVYNFSAIYETDLKFNKDVELIVESDDGVTVFVDGRKVLEDKTCHSAAKSRACVLEAKVSHHVKIYYFQGGGEASIALYCSPAAKKYNLESRKTYLPAGEWIDANTGKEYAGGKTVSRKYGYDVMPLFIKRGAVIPLVSEAQNTKKQSWRTVVYDYYPSLENAYSTYLYEDDRTTVAYKDGILRKSPVTAGYDAVKRAFTLNLGASEGPYSDGLKTRKAIIKFHVLKGAESVRSVFVDGVETPFTVKRKSKRAAPFTTLLNSCDGATLIVKLSQPLSRDVRVEFFKN